eukprot:m.248739 g.248739  ORF g.248739 m.248739 type:complete len:344 (+) comp15833_c0_seq1:186-1217(+)
MLAACAAQSLAELIFTSHRRRSGACRAARTNIGRLQSRHTRVVCKAAVSSLSSLSVPRSGFLDQGVTHPPRFFFFALLRLGRGGLTFSSSESLPRCSSSIRASCSSSARRCRTVLLGSFFDDTFLLSPGPAALLSGMSTEAMDPVGRGRASSCCRRPQVQRYCATIPTRARAIHDAISTMLHVLRGALPERPREIVSSTFRMEEAKLQPSKCPMPATTANDPHSAVASTTSGLGLRRAASPPMAASDAQSTRKCVSLLSRSSPCSSERSQSAMPSPAPAPAVTRPMRNAHTEKTAPIAPAATLIPMSVFSVPGPQHASVAMISGANTNTRRNPVRNPHTHSHA